MDLKGQQIMALLNRVIEHGSLVERVQRPVKLMLCCTSQRGWASGALAGYCLKLFQEYKRAPSTGGCHHHRQFLARCFRERNHFIVASLHDNLKPYVDGNDDMLQKIYEAWPFHMIDDCTSRVGIRLASELCDVSNAQRCGQH
jgi:hypothetical protein